MREVEVAPMVMIMHMTTNMYLFKAYTWKGYKEDSMLKKL